mmetsp:Transcript_3110/g.4709  ORF Transcript_3110/g.4709 Transcript_3110/m.4709 type:complete len:463 (-) Transcript_3110:83-1471(-)
MAMSHRITSLFLLIVLRTLIVRGEDENHIIDDDDDDEWGANVEPHPDPNDEDYDDMIYMGRYDHSDERRRVGFDEDNGVKYIFGTSFDETHKAIEEADLHHDRVGPDAHSDLPQNSGRTREQVLFERRHKNITNQGPKPFGYFDSHELDGGMIPPRVVRVEPFFLDDHLVTNQEFGKFIRSTYYETEAEKYGWSFVLSSFLTSSDQLETAETDPEAEHWVAVEGAYWRRPEGPASSYKYRENHPVVHVSHRDAAEYCLWIGKRLPGEREWEAAARAGHWGPSNRTMYSWGEDPTIAKDYANLWGNGTFPYVNHAEDGWRGTSPVKTYPPNAMGFYDMIGNVWEWQRGGKHKERIVRGSSYVDSVDGSFNHAATLGARATLHGTTTTGNVGFRCAKAPKRRTEHHYVHHDEEVHGELAIEDQFGKRDAIPQRGWEDRFGLDFDEDDRPRRKVVKPRTTISTEL